MHAEKVTFYSAKDTAMHYDLTAVTMIAIFYFFPAIVSIHRRHHNRLAISAMNLLLGWTFLGWIAAFIWGLTAVREY